MSLSRLSGRLSIDPVRDCPLQNRESDRHSDRFTVSTRRGWSEPGSHGDALALLAASNSVYTVLEFFFAENTGGQEVAHVRWNLAGNVTAATPPGADDWKIAAATTDPSAAPAHDHISQCGRRRVGRRAQFVEIDGVRYSHIVDPRTGG